MEGKKSGSGSGSGGGGSGGSKSYETYKKVSTLGVGSFGTAYLVECQSSKEMAVIKQIDI